MDTLIGIYAELLAQGHGSDKGTEHSYLPFYEGVLASVREQPIRLLEIGVLNGDSLRLWRRYFVAAEVVGIDINPDTPPVDGTTLVIGDARQTGMAVDLGQFDVIVDDGSHAPDDVVAVFAEIFPHLAPGGLYVIEDIEHDEAARRYHALAAFTEVDFRPSGGQFNDRLMWTVKAHSGL